MKKQRINIAILEPSDIVYEGLESLLMKAAGNFCLFRLTNFEEAHHLCESSELSSIFVNPWFVQNRENELNKLKNNFPKVNWIGLVYSFFDKNLLAYFDQTILITENINSITKKLENTEKNTESNQPENINLTEREIDVLKHLTKGFSNKEIADKLNISAHTVISHRKNIVEKTGIRSLSGLTIYAISKKIISL